MDKISNEVNELILDDVRSTEEAMKNINFDKATLLGLTPEEKVRIFHALQKGERVIVKTFTIQPKTHGGKTVYDDGFVSPDPLIGTCFPNPTRKFGVVKLNDNHIITSFTRDRLSAELLDFDKNMTIKIRKRIKERNLVYSNPCFKRFWRQPLYSTENQIVIPLFSGNKFHANYLTMNNPVARQYLYEVFQAAVEIYGEENAPALTPMLTFWNFNFPHTVTIKRLKNSQITTRPFFKETIEECGKTFFWSLIRPLFEGTAEYLKECTPRYKADKSLGPYGTLPDGSLYSDDRYVKLDIWEKEAKKLSTDAKLNLYRKANNLYVRIEWINSEKMKEDYNWKILKADFSSEEDLLEAFDRLTLSGGFMLRRENNTDVNLGGYSKDRRWSLETAPVEFEDGLSKSKEFNHYLKTSVLPKFTEVTNKEVFDAFCAKKSRAAYNVDNSSNGVPAIMLARTCLKQFEDSEVGFPSSRDKMKSSYERFYEATKGKWRIFLKGDNVNSEQTMTEMYEVQWELLTTAPEFADIWKKVMTIITPSEYGPLFQQLACLSGLPYTTLNNFVFGFFRTITAIIILLYGRHPSSQHIREVSKILLYSFLMLKDYAVIPYLDGFVYIPLKSCLDDTIQIISGDTSRQLRETQQHIQELKAYGDETRFEVEVGTIVDATFGMSFAQNRPPIPDQKLSVAKWFNGANEPQKVSIGDFLCFKLFSHLVQMDSRLTQRIREIGIRLGLGDIFECELYAVAAMVDHILLHHSVSSMYEAESPTTKLLLPEGVSAVMLKRDQHYTQAEMQPYRAVLREKLSSFYQLGKNEGLDRYDKLLSDLPSSVRELNKSVRSGTPVWC